MKQILKKKKTKKAFQTKGGKHMNEKQKEFYKLYSKRGEEMEGKSWLEIVKQNEVATNTMLINKIAPQVLVLVREHQKGRGAKNAPSGAFDFTEGWFRNSGLYDLCEKYQLALIEVY